MPVRNAEAQWSGDLLSGAGKMKLGSGAYEGQYSFKSRMESGVGTNPEELIGAAHAGCYSMALSAILGKAGFKPESVHTKAGVKFEKVGDGFSITGIHLDVEGKVPSCTAEQFLENAIKAKAGCPVSRALASVEITLDAKLI